MPPGASIKPKQSKKQETIRSDLAHILGYTGADMDPIGPPSPVGSEKEAAGMSQSLVMQYCVLSPAPVTILQTCAQHSLIICAPSWNIYVP